MSEIQKTPPLGSDGGGSEQIQGHSKQNDTRKVHLQDQLADLLDQWDDPPSDVEALDRLLGQLEEVSPLPDGLLSNAEEELMRFHQKYSPVFDAVEAAAPSPAPTRRRSHRPFVRMLPIAAALVLLLGATTAQAFGVFSAIARWTSELFRLNDNDVPSAVVRIRPLEKGETAYYDSLEDALAAFGIEAPLVPQEIPERFELVEVTATQNKSAVRIQVNYEYINEALWICYKEGASDFYSLEKEYGVVNSYFAGNIEHYLVEDLDRWKALWQNGDFECLLSGDISETEMKDMIDSIYKE